ncbi:MAG: NAD(P)/FAD-dependent oxidoreductase [Pseudomonadota bacterium]|nr:NAD(P)/FAD-dependent oxidoreductase [Pseudomonadota bacterium]
MSLSDSTYDVAVIGAGSAGLAAADTAAKAGLSVVLIEAAHRIGGRAYTDTESLGFAFDLGCHWMHSASLNPYVAIAEAHGHAYIKESYPRDIHLGDRWATDAECDECEAFYDRCYGLIDDAVAAGHDAAVADVTPREDRWTPIFDMSSSTGHSVDNDQVSVLDSAAYNDTDENWPLIDGYGALVATHFGHVPVALNCGAERVDWSGNEVAVTTPKGVIRAARAIITVSTGVLAAGDIGFEPGLPDWKLAAIASLPLGSHNRVGMAFDRNVFGADAPRGFTVYCHTPETVAFQIRPFGRDHVVGLYGGRFSDWLERSGPAAMTDHAIENLKQVFGNDIGKHIVKTTCSAWGGDPLVRGAYSCAPPGHAGAREGMAAAVDERLFFAGEATSPEFFATCHGAYISGKLTANDVAESLGGGVREAL